MPATPNLDRAFNLPSSTFPAVRPQYAFQISYSGQKTKPSAICCRALASTRAKQRTHSPRRARIGKIQSKTRPTPPNRRHPNDFRPTQTASKNAHGDRHFPGQSGDACPAMPQRTPNILEEIGWTDGSALWGKTKSAGPDLTEKNAGMNQESRPLKRPPQTQGRLRKCQKKPSADPPRADGSMPGSENEDRPKCRPILSTPD
jgi:hypothetical protein